MQGKHHTIMENYTAADFKSCIAIPFFVELFAVRLLRLKYTNAIAHNKNQYQGEESGCHPPQGF